MKDVLMRQIEGLRPRLEDLKGILDLNAKKTRIQEINALMEAQGFWDDQAQANKVMAEFKYLKSCVEPYEKSVRRLQDAAEFIELSGDDELMLKQIETDLNELESDIRTVEVNNLLSGPFDRNNAILSIHAGAGGTESCDWSNMLYRMYSRWAEQQGAKLRVLDILPGDEAGIKSVTVSIEGEMIYGRLKAERGVHRLVRISPFDSNKRRHTSFSSVDVSPEVEEELDVEIKSDDLRIDVFRSSGPGGQSVNTTDSAVRITHIPTGIAVASQSERSQLQNKAVAMRILKGRLFELKQQEQEEKLSKETGEKRKIEWGSQIRSYVMQPYLLVKDHRTDVETSNVPKVLDGGIDLFIEAYLRYMKR